MTPFQWIFGGLLTSALALELLLQAFQLSRRPIGMFRSSVWLSALLLVLFPGIMQSIASTLRIGRGADFLLYTLAICFPIGGFYLLHAIEKQRQQLTVLVRTLAKQSPVHEPNHGDSW